MRFISVLALAMLCAGAATVSHAQRSQSLCKDLVEAIDAGTETGEPEIDGVPCIRAEGRFYADDGQEGYEEAATIGLGFADRTLTNAELNDLEDTRIELVGALGADSYLFIDWMAIVRTSDDGIAAGTATPSVGLGVAIDAAGTGAIDGVTDIYWAAGGFGSLFGEDDPVVRRQTPLRGGIGESSVANAPIVLGVAGDADDWDALMALVPAAVTLRVILRYRVITTADTF